MKNLTMATLAITLSLALFGCQKVKTQQYYTQHTDEMYAVLDECKAENQKGNKVEGTLAENCKNARGAMRVVIANSIHQSQ